MEAAHELEGPLGQHAALAPAALLERTPTYACVECARPYRPSDERCLTCGALIPFGAGQGVLVHSQSYAQAERTVAALLERLGHVPARLFVRDGVWRIPLGETELWVRLDPKGDYVDFEAHLSKLPADGHEAFYRFLLTVDDQASGRCRLALDADTVTLTYSEPTAFLNPGEVSAALEHMMALGTAVRALLKEGFGAEPAPSQLEQEL